VVVLTGLLCSKRPIVITAEERHCGRMTPGGRDRRTTQLQTEAFGLVRPVNLAVIIASPQSTLYRPRISELAVVP
jgi:hypothetical protein